MKRSLFISLFLVFLEIACFPAEQQDRKTKVLAQGLTIQIPVGLAMTRQRQTEDFELVVFKSGTNTTLRVYLGNQPDFPKEKGVGPIQKETINGLHAESTRQKKADGTISREVLFRLRDDGIWPQRMHCWYANLSAKDSAEADQMLSSVRLANNHAGDKAR